MLSNSNTVSSPINFSVRLIASVNNRVYAALQPAFSPISWHADMMSNCVLTVFISMPVFSETLAVRRCAGAWLLVLASALLMHVDSWRFPALGFAFRGWFWVTKS